MGDQGLEVNKILHSNNLIKENIKPTSSQTFHFKDVINLVCDASFDPILIISETKIYGCNSRLLEVLGYRNEVELFLISTPQLIQKHFYPKSININFNTNKSKTDSFKNGSDLQSSKLNDLIRASICVNENKRFASVRVKPWPISSNLLSLPGASSEPLYSLSIRDVPILSIMKENAESLALKRNVPAFTNIKKEGSASSILTNNLNLNSKQVKFPLPLLFDPNLNKNVFEEFSDIFDSLPCLVWYIGSEGELLYMNKRYKEVFGIENLNENFSVCIHPEDYQIMAPKWKSCLKNKSPFSIEVRIRYNPNKPVPLDLDPTAGHKDYRWYAISSLPMLHPTEPSLTRWVSSALNINNLKIAQDEQVLLAKAANDATQASKMKSDFLAMMSHEIRTPLFGVVGNTCLLKETDLDCEQMELVEAIDLSGKLLMSVITDVLDFSQIESGRMSIQLGPFKVGELIRHVASMLKSEANRKDIEFSASFPNLAIDFIGDASRILQILTNLTSNAIKFTSQGSVSLLARIIPYVSLESEGYTFKGFKESDPSINKSVILLVRIVDTGIGISSAELPTLFTPWTQAMGGSSHRRIRGGSGLGLSICKSLVSLMGGDIWLESQFGQGTTAWFWLPLDMEHEGEKLDLSNCKFTNLQESLNTETDLLTTVKFAPSSSVHRSPSSSHFSVNSNESDDKDRYNKHSQNLDEKLSRLAPPINTSIKRRLKASGEDDIAHSYDSTKTSNWSNTHPSEIDHFNAYNYRVLVAEDNAVNQAILGKFLKKMGGIGYKIIGDGDTALEIYQSLPRRHFDIILLDRTLPGMSGDEVARRIHQLDSQQIIISISADPIIHSSDAETELNNCIADHLPKPITFDKFKSVINHWLSKGYKLRTGNGS